MPSASSTAARPATPPPQGSSRTASPAVRAFRTQDVVDLIGVSRRQLQYWARTGLVVPSASTRGGHHRYSFRDLVALKTARRLIDAGISVQRIRRSLHALQQRLPEIERPLEELVIVATGDVLLVLDGSGAFEALTGQQWVIEVAEFQRELDAWELSRRGRGTAERTRRMRRVRTEGRRERSAG